MFVIKAMGVIGRTQVWATACLFTAVVTSLSCGGSSPTSQVVPPVNKTVTALAINPTNPDIQVGATQQFTAMATFSDSSTPTDVTTSVTWSSSNPSVASITGTGTGAGVATGVTGGSADIMATLGNITSDTTLTVSGGTATGLALSVINPSIAPGAKLQVVAVIEYSDGSNQKVTSSATWISSNSAVATVETSGGSHPGMVAGVAPGTTTISASATAGGTNFKGQATLTVVSNAAMVPLMDMTSAQNYLGFEGGLYENSSDTVPADHAADGVKAADAIKPRDQNGNASSNGAMVFLGIGMSNATLEFSAFVNATASSQSVNHSTLAVLDGAYGSVTACPWTVATGLPNCPEYTSGVPSENQYDRVRDTVLATATGAPSAPAGCGGPPATPCLTEKQVQVLWIKNANPSPALHSLASLLPFSDNCASEVGTIEACNYESQLGKTIRAAKARYPNLQQIFISTRIYAGYASVPLNPEPYAYEYGFSAKWLIQAQIDQMRPSGTPDPVAGDLDYTNGTAAWTAWGPYLWAYGTTKRSDGLFWCNGQTGSPCNGEDDFQSDGTHPSPDVGVPKVVNLMMKFFSTSPYTPGWFCASGNSC